MTTLRLLGSDKDKQNVCYRRATRKVRDPVEIQRQKGVLVRVWRWGYGDKATSSLHPIESHATLVILFSPPLSEVFTVIAMF